MVDFQMEEYCQVISADRSHSPIELDDGKPQLIGRGPLTHIMDKKVSRDHVSFLASSLSQHISVEWSVAASYAIK